MESLLLDAAGHRRSPATMPGYHQARAPRNKGIRYPADPPTIEETIAVMRAAGDGAEGARLRDRDRSGPISGSGPRSPRQRRSPTRGRNGPLAMGSTRTVATAPGEASDRRDALRDARENRWPSLGVLGRA